MICTYIFNRKQNSLNHPIQSIHTMEIYSVAAAILILKCFKQMQVNNSNNCHIRIKVNNLGFYYSYFLTSGRNYSLFSLQDLRGQKYNTKYVHINCLLSILLICLAFLSVSCLYSNLK